MKENLLKIKVINKLVCSTISIILMFNSSKRKKLRNCVQNIWRNTKKQQIANLIKEKYSDCYCIFSRYGIGDIFFVASLLKEFKKKNGGKIVYFTEKKRLVAFLKAFPSIDEVVFDKDIKFLQEEQVLQQNLQKGKLQKLFFPYRGTKPTYTFSDNYNNLLDLPLNAPRELPVINKKNYAIADEEFKRLNINPPKTVLIIPDAMMFDYRIIDSSFWIKLASKIQNFGYEPVFNLKTNKYKKFKHTFLHVMDFTAFAQQVKYIISFRSGISDLLVGMKMFNISVLYPPNLEVIWADTFLFHELHKRHMQKFNNEFDNIFAIHSLNNVFKQNNIDEIIYNYNDEEISNRIISKINSEAVNE